MAVYNRSKEALLQASELVRTETLESANSAERVGLLFYDITEHILDVTVTPEYPAGTNSVLIADIVVDGQNNLIYAPKGGGGGPTNDGYQKVYFATVLKGVTVQAPTSEDYDPSADGGTGAFTRSTPQWHSTDDLPAEGECVYAIWVYFNANNLIVTIDGPVVINSGNSGSNGEDGEEIEWIYIRKPEELTPIQMTLILNFLETCKGSAAAKDGKTFNDPDAVPQGDWTDNALGIDENLQYEYAAFRKSKNDENTKKRTWGDDYFHGPLLWSAYGKQGMDGDGVEYIFYADRDGSPSWGSGDYPPNWNDNTQGNWKDPNDHSKGRWTFQDNEFIAEGSRWTDNPINIETLQKGAKQWSCMRKKQDGVWQAYQVPTLWSYYAKDGVANGYTTDIVNENMPVGTDNEGTATNYTNHGRVLAFHNEDALQYTSTVGASGYPAEGFFTYVIGDITRSDDPEHVALNIDVTPNLNDGAQFDVSISSISNFANVNAYIPITVKLPNGTDQYLECTLYGIATGEAGQAVDIWTNADVIRDNDTGSGTAPAQLQIGVKIGRGEDIHTYYSGGVPSAESMNFYFGYRYDDGQMLALTPGTLTLEPNHSTLTIEMRQGNSFAEGHFVDSEDIPYVKNGATITNIQPYYRAVDSESKKPGTNGYSDISLNDSSTVEGTGFGNDYPFLYRRDYYTFSDGVAYFGVTVFDRRYFEPIVEEAAYVIATINDNAAIDDLTIGDNALRIATLNPITVYKGNDNVTSNCIFDILNKTLNTLELDVESTTDSSYPNSKVYHIVKKNSSLTKFTPGSYSYDIKVSDSNYNEIGRKRFKLYIDKDISTDGSFYKLVIENDTIEYDSSGTVVSLNAPTAKVYKVPINGDPVQQSATVVKTKPTTPSENLYLLVDNTLYNAATTSQQDIVFNTANIPYKADKYELTLYKGNKYQDGPEYIDCTKEASVGVDGYSLVTNPAYIIIDELIANSGTTNPSTGVVTYYALTLTPNELKQQYAIIKVLKGKTPLVINYNSFSTTIGDATIVDASTGGAVSSSTTALKVYLTSVPQKTASSSPTGWNQSEGKITFTVTLGGSSFYSVEIPVYINRLGTRFQTIAGDVETTMMSKTAYVDTNGNPVKWRDLGTYVRSSLVNISQLETKVDELTRSISKILLTSDDISLSVYAGLRTLYFRDTELTVSAGGTKDIYLSRCDKVSTTTFPPNGVYTVRYSADVFLDSRVTNGYVGVSFYYELEDETSDYYMELEYAANKVGRWVSIEGFENMTSKIIGFDTSLEYVFELYNSTEYTAKIKNVRVELVTTDSKTLYGAGIDISAGRIDMLADNFTLRNNKGEQTLGVDSSGNFEVSGTIKAYNLYRNICIITGWYSTLSSSSSIFYSSNWYYCSLSTDETERYGYEVGKYYENPKTYDGMVQCTYAADIISLRNNASHDWPSGGIICIPRPLDFPGKTIEIRHNATNGNNTAVLKACDGSLAFADFLYSTVGGTESIRAYYPVVSLTVLAYDTMSLYSYYFKGDGKYYWRIVGLIHGGGLTADVNNIHYEDGLAKRTL